MALFFLRLPWYNDATPISKYAKVLVGLITSDSNRFVRSFWEVINLRNGWEFFQSAPKISEVYAGRSQIIFWQEGRGVLYELVQSVKHTNHPAQNWLSGKPLWGYSGICVSQSGNLPATIYLGDRYDNSCFAVVPNNESLLPALWAFFSSPTFNTAARKINPKKSIEKSLLLNTFFNLEYWQQVADEQYPNGLPEPYSEDPTQWIFKGTITPSTEPLQVAVARLLGYRWHEQIDDGLADLIDSDGIVCLPSIQGEQPAAERLRQLLVKAYGNAWTPHTLKELLTAEGYGDKTLDDWLKHGFFEQHCKLFQQRPFVWHLWDGNKNGFSVLVNYHKLTHKTLETLTYTYLGDWIRYQQKAVQGGESGADAKLLDAQKLQQKLELILTGEQPYDIFVRWKPLEQQAIGWHPDLNDGVRLNIRPFVQANILRKKPTINWNKDRGKNPPGSPWGEDRINDFHLTLEEKRNAREASQR